MVVLEPTAEALSALDVADARKIGGLDQLVLDPLVVTLPVVVLRVFADRACERRLAEEEPATLGPVPRPTSPWSTTASKSVCST